MKSGSRNSALISPSSSLPLAHQTTYRGLFLADNRRTSSSWYQNLLPSHHLPCAKNDPLVRGLLLAVQSNANPSENPTGFEGHKDEDDERERREGSPLRSLSLNSSPTTQLPLFCQDQEQVFLLRSALRAEVSASPKCDPGKYLTVSVECLGGGGIRRASNI